MLCVSSPLCQLLGCPPWFCTHRAELILIISLIHDFVVFGDGGVRLNSYLSEKRFKFFFKHLRARPTQIHPLPQKFHLRAALHKSAHNTLFQQAIFCTARYLTDTTLSMKTVWSCHDYLSRHHWQKEICAWTIAAEIFQAIFFSKRIQIWRDTAKVLKIKTCDLQCYNWMRTVLQIWNIRFGLVFKSSTTFVRFL